MRFFRHSCSIYKKIILGIYMYDEFSQEDIRWNFEKILFDKDGKPYRNKRITFNFLYSLTEMKTSLNCIYV